MLQSKLTWGPYFWFHVWRAATSTISGVFTRHHYICKSIDVFWVKITSSNKMPMNVWVTCYLCTYRNCGPFL